MKLLSTMKQFRPHKEYEYEYAWWWPCVAETREQISERNVAPKNGHTTTETQKQTCNTETGSKVFPVLY
jgi:hypothetical protein